MAILARPAERPAILQSVCEVRVEIQLERRAAIVRFYEDVLLLRSWPTALQVPGSWGVGEPRRGVLFVYRHDPRVDPLRRRFTVAVHTLAYVERRLRRRDWPYIRRRGLGASDERILLADPIGHRLELREFRLF